MKNFTAKIKLYITKHKIISAIIVIVIILAGYWGYKKATSTSGDTRYITAAVGKGTIIASVSGTGQVSALSQIDVKPKASGDVVYIGAKNGDKVATGALLAELDTSDAEKSVRDAEQSLESAQLSLQKLKIQNSEENMSADLKKAYDDASTDISDTFLDLPTVVNGLKDLLAQKNLSDNTATSVSKVAETYRTKAETSYFDANKAFEQNRKDYIALTSNSSPADIENILTETSATATLVSDAVKDMLDFVNYMADHSNDATSYTAPQGTLSTYTNTIASHLSALTSAQTDINNNQDSSQNADIDLQSSELSIQQKEDAVQDAKDNLADYYVRAPFAGTVTGMTIKKGDSASSSTVIATLITDKQIAEVSMNEVDVAKIKVGEKATLTFDAVPDLTISGEVDEIDSIGTVSQGVVTYNVKITFDTEDARVKPSMSVSAAIITDMKQDVLVVPNSAVKSQEGQSYVEMFPAPLPAPTDGLVGSISTVPPNKIPVDIGLSNDSETEIVSGLQEGDEIVTRTISPSSTTTAAAAPSLFGSSTPARGATTGRTTGGAFPSR